MQAKTKTKETPEDYYARLARQDERGEEETGKSFGPEDVLPIKTLGGELQYRMSEKVDAAEDGPSTVEERRTALKRKKGDGEGEENEDDEETDGAGKGAGGLKTKKQRREDLKRQKREDKKKKEGPEKEKKVGAEDEVEGEADAEGAEGAEEDGLAVPTQEEIVRRTFGQTACFELQNAESVSWTDHR